MSAVDENYRLAFIFNPCLCVLDLLRSIQREFGIESEASEIGTLVHSLNEFLLQQRREGRTVALVIDEAQNLEPSVLEPVAKDRLAVVNDLPVLEGVDIERCTCPIAQWGAVHPSLPSSSHK